MDDESLNEPFLSRWSRRKLAAKDEAPAEAVPASELPPAQAAVPAIGTQPGEAVSAEAAPIYSPEDQQFFNPRVEEKLRRAALKKVFSEPQFNVMDGLDIYIDDYSKPDPIPEAMLRQLNQAKSLFLFDEEEKDAAAGDAGAGALASAGEPLAPPANAIAPPDAPVASGAESDEELNAAAAAAAAGSKND
jgi:hypothetical protein